MNLLNANTTPPGYPRSAADLRATFPNTSFPGDLTEAILAPFGWHLVQLTPRPPDTRNERYEDTAALIEGAWQQVWVARAATAQEQAKWDAAHQPPADWLSFAGWLYQFPPIAAAMDAARLSTEPQGEPATTGLPTALDEARLRQNYPAFSLTWGLFLQASGMPVEALGAIVAKAAECNLPAEFIAALQPTTDPQP